MSRKWQTSVLPGLKLIFRRGIGRKMRFAQLDEIRGDLMLADGVG